MNVSLMYQFNPNIFAIIIALFFNLLRSQQESKVAVDRESHKEMEKLKRMRDFLDSAFSRRKPDQQLLRRLSVKLMV